MKMTCNMVQRLNLINAINFAQTPSCINLLSEFPNLIILQTLSKAIGCAGLRLGIGFMHPAIVAVLNKIKHPYNISTVNQQIAIQRLADTERIEEEIVMIRTELQRMEKALLTFRMVEKIFPSEANFLLVRCRNHEELYHFLWSNGIVVRNRGGQFRCEGVFYYIKVFCVLDVISNIKLNFCLSAITRDMSMTANPKRE